MTGTIFLPFETPKIKRLPIFPSLTYWIYGSGALICQKGYANN
jgi:hypothetical protein